MTRYSGQWMVTTPTHQATIRVDLDWAPSDPLAIWIIFPVQGVCWEVSRDLLREGLAAPAGTPVGEGDLRIAPSLHHPDELLTIDMISPRTGSATRLHAPIEDLTSFLADTDRVLPPQDEDLAPALEHMLARILEGQTR
ncbi:SsgA family sporulation/cell division regulator [Nocardiopsis alba]|uniref:SsgA family sporulation/cell division regulator n=1 Tax=Nocardiopsis alba TaxID=53437 RepID=UPI0036716E6C